MPVTPKPKKTTAARPKPKKAAAKPLPAVVASEPMPTTRQLEAADTPIFDQLFSEVDADMATVVLNAFDVSRDTEPELVDAE